MSTRWRAPGRVNLIGEHTDYNEGFALPFTIEQGCTATVDERADDRVVVRSAQRDDTVDVRLLVPFGVQTGLSLGFHVTGTVTTQTYDSAGNVTSTTTQPVDTMFAVRRALG